MEPTGVGAPADGIGSVPTTATHRGGGRRHERIYHPAQTNFRPFTPESGVSTVRFLGWTCPECDSYHREVSGARTRDGETQIRCPACRTVEQFQALEVVA